MEEKKGEEVVVEELELEDRAIYGLNEGYTIEQPGRLYSLLLRGGMKDGPQPVIGADFHLLRTRLDFLMLHTMMLRGESTRKAELADLYTVLLPYESSE